MLCPTPTGLDVICAGSLPRMMLRTAALRKSSGGGCLELVISCCLKMASRNSLGRGRSLKARVPAQQRHHHLARPQVGYFAPVALQRISVRRRSYRLKRGRALVCLCGSAEHTREYLQLNPQMLGLNCSSEFILSSWAGQRKVEV